MNLVILTLIVIFSFSCYFFGKSKVLNTSKVSGKKFHSLPEYYGYYLAAWCGIPALIILFFWSFSELFLVKIFILADFKIDPLLDENKLNLIFTRNQILKDTDKYLICDFPITADNLIKIKEYRQLLRDFTNNNYILPDKPDFLL